jgi:hypothetical protein
MGYRLLVDLDVIDVMNHMPKKTRDRLMEHFGRLRQYPDTSADFYESERNGRRVEISIFAGYAIHYWVDFADRHVKILALKPA